MAWRFSPRSVPTPSQLLRKTNLATRLYETYTITVEDQRVPEIYTPEDMVVEIPSCEEDIPVNWTVSTVDDCDVQPTLDSD